MIKLKEIRTALNRTQSDLADQLNIKRNTICDWELGKSEPSIERLKELAIILSVSADMLLDHPINNNSTNDSFQEIAVKKQIQMLTNKEQDTLYWILEKLDGGTDK